MVVNLIEEIKNLRQMSIQLEADYLGKVKGTIYQRRAVGIISKTKHKLHKLSTMGMSTIVNYRVMVNKNNNVDTYEVIYSHSFTISDIKWLIHLMTGGDVIRLDEIWIMKTGSLVKIQ